jgi:hypothetical protein
MKQGVAQFVRDRESLAVGGLANNESDCGTVLFGRPTRHSAVAVE